MSLVRGIPAIHHPNYHTRPPAEHLIAQEKQAEPSLPSYNTYTVTHASPNSHSLSKVIPAYVSPKTTIQTHHRLPIQITQPSPTQPHYQVLPTRLGSVRYLSTSLCHLPTRSPKPFLYNGHVPWKISSRLPRPPAQPAADKTDIFLLFVLTNPIRINPQHLSPAILCPPTPCIYPCCLEHKNAGRLVAHDHPWSSLFPSYMTRQDNQVSTSLPSKMENSAFCGWYTD